MTAPLSRKDAYLASHETLLREWADCREDFFYDGVINPEQWFNPKVRPLFLLKEAYIGERDPHEYDLRKWMDGKTYTNEIKTSNFIVFKKILQWASILLGEATGADAREKCGEYCLNNPIFQRIAYVNVKKYGGTSLSEDADLMKFAAEHAARLRAQIELIDPTVIVCCGTMRLFRLFFDGDEHPQENAVPSLHKREINGHSLYVSDFWHPAYFREKESFYCEKIADVYREMTGKNASAR